MAQRRRGRSNAEDIRHRKAYIGRIKNNHQQTPPPVFPFGDTGGGVCYSSIFIVLFSGTLLRNVIYPLQVCYSSIFIVLFSGSFNVNISSFQIRITFLSQIYCSDRIIREGSYISVPVICSEFERSF